MVFINPSQIYENDNNNTQKGLTQTPTTHNGAAPSFNFKNFIIEMHNRRYTGNRLNDRSQASLIQTTHGGGLSLI